MLLLLKINIMQTSKTVPGRIILMQLWSCVASSPVASKVGWAQPRSVYYSLQGCSVKTLVFSNPRDLVRLRYCVGVGSEWVYFQTSHWGPDWIWIQSIKGPGGAAINPWWWQENDKVLCSWHILKNMKTMTVNEVAPPQGTLLKMLHQQGCE